MGDWRILHKDVDLTVGMWTETGVVYFTYEGDPDKGEVEFPVAIEDLKKIVSNAKQHEKTTGGD